MKRQARMRDVAKLAEVSTMTVSRVLSGAVKVSDETRVRVLDAVARLNYRPNEIARSLREQRTGTVGLIVPNLLYTYFSKIIIALTAEVRKQGYSLIISSSEEDPALEKQEIEHLLARRVDVLLIASSQLTVESFHSIEQHNIPFVLIDRRLPGLAANFVGVDDVKVGELVTEHLIEQGCRRIAHIRGPEVSPALGRLEGFRRALARHRLSPAAIVSSSSSGFGDRSERGYDAMRKLLKDGPKPDGVFCYNDPTALGAMQAILDSGLTIPGDIAVAGCGNLLYSDYMRTPLTSVDQDCYAIGQRAAEIALSLINGKSGAPPKTELISATLVVRESSRRITPMEAKSRSNLKRVALASAKE